MRRRGRNSELVKARPYKAVLAFQLRGVCRSKGKFFDGCSSFSLEFFEIFANNGGNVEVF